VPLVLAKRLADAENAAVKIKVDQHEVNSVDFLAPAIREPRSLCAAASARMAANSSSTTIDHAARSTSYQRGARPDRRSGPDQFGSGHRPGCQLGRLHGTAAGAA
jgi:hypothetical protein